MQEFRSKVQTFCAMRFKVVGFILILIALVVVVRLLYLTTVDRSFLINKSLQQANHPRIIPASRGVIFDRDGVPLAVSAPIDNIIFDGKVLSQNPDDWQLLANNPNLGLSYTDIQNLLAPNPNDRYIIAKKNLPPDIADSVDEMNIPGVYVERNQQSFYPEGPALAQLVGFTDGSDAGQSGLELSYDNYLKPTYGKQSVTESALGQTYSINHLMKEAKDGHDLYLSIDSRLQYAAYQAVAAQVQSTGAIWGGAVIMNPHTGEVLAATSYPSYNPNTMTTRSGENLKDHVITDNLEPGSTMKPITVTAALISGKYTPTTMINATGLDYITIGGYQIKDDAHYGPLTVAGVITKSSDIGISTIGLSLPRQELYNTFLSFGFGQKPSGGKYPGETPGFVWPLNTIGDHQFATMMFGYSISASLVQMARVYSVYANGGTLLPVSYVKLDAPPEGTRVMDPKIAAEMMKILETVVNPNSGGTGMLANVPGYIVAGKTGTAQFLGPGGYSTSKHNAFFVGVIPANDPQLVIAVVLFGPQQYWPGYGAIGAAPVFSKIAMASMHILGVPPSTDKVNLKLFQNQQQYYKQLVEN